MRFLILSLFLSLFGNILAQSLARPLMYNGKEVYVMMTPINHFKIVETKRFEDAGKLTYGQWLGEVAKQVPEHEYDAIVSRDENMIMYITFNQSNDERVGLLSNLISNKIDIYFCSFPVNDYEVVSELELNDVLVGNGFYFLVKQSINRFKNLHFEGMIIDVEEGTVSCIRYVFK